MLSSNRNDLNQVEIMKYKPNCQSRNDEKTDLSNFCDVVVVWRATRMLRRTGNQEFLRAPRRRSKTDFLFKFAYFLNKILNLETVILINSTFIV
jgi:hypothetical protein